jgi:hypothetical protein
MDVISPKIQQAESFTTQEVIALRPIFAQNPS